jgi:dephospho-CoA kinase
MRNAVGFSGGIGSGKSALSDVVARALGWPRASFGDYVRSVASQRGLAATRETCQALGQELIDSDTSGFCEAVLASVGWSPGSPVVVDGIRHLRVLDILAGMVGPSGLTLVFVDTPRGAREGRLKTRDGHTQPLDVLERHATEFEVARLRERSDLILDGERPVKQLRDEVMSHLES